MFNLTTSFCRSSNFAKAINKFSLICSSPKNSIAFSNTVLAPAIKPFCSSNLKKNTYNNCFIYSN